MDTQVGREEPVGAARGTEVGQSSESWPAPKTAWYTMFVLVLCLTFAQLDLQIMTLLVAPIKRDLHLTDFEFSLLVGFAFGIFYTFVGLPMARFVDRSSRKRLLAIGLTVWSLATAATGLAQNFIHVFLARVFVGAGESVNGPASYSIVSDLFPRERLTRAIAVLQLGSVIGPGIAMVLSAYVIHLFIDMKPVAVPWGVIHGWQIIFIVVGLPGVLVGLLMQFTMPEPARRGLGLAARPKVSMMECLRYTCGEKGAVFLPLFISLAISGLDASRTWMPAFYGREFHWHPAKVALILGLSNLVVVPFGLWGGVRLTEYLQKKGRDDAPMLVVLLGRFIGLPFSIFGVLLPNPWLVVATSIVGGAVLGMTGAPLNAAMQSVAPNQMRGQITAVYLFIFSVVGTGIGPTVVAAITNFVFRDEALLKWSIFTAHAAFLPISLIVFAVGVRPFAREMARIRGIEANGAAGAAA